MSLTPSGAALRRVAAAVAFGVVILVLRRRAGGIDVAGALETLRGMGLAGVALLGASWTAAGLLVLPTAPLSIAAGWLYGPLLGTAVAAPATALGVLPPFLLGRTLLRAWARRRWEADPRLRALAAVMRRRGLRVALVLRVVPFMPFPVLNFVFGAMPVRAKDFAAGTLLGSIPTNLLWTSVGALLAVTGRRATEALATPAWMLCAGAALFAAAIWAAWREVTALLREGSSGPADDATPHPR